MSRAPAPIPFPIEPVVTPDRTALAGPPPRPGWSRAWVWLSFLALVAMAAGYGWHVRTKEAARSAPIVVRSATVGSGIVARSIRLTGVTAAENAVALTAPQLFGSRSIGGRHGDFNLLLQELAPAGSLVKQGDQVASFDRLHMSLRLDEHRTNVNLHEAYMRILTAAFEVRRKAQEQKIGKAKGAVDKAELDLKTAPVRSAIQTERFRLVLEEEKARYKEYLDQWKWFDDSERSSIRRLELDIKEQRLGLQRAERNMDLMAVRAPIPGILVVQTVHRHGGETAQIQAGDQINPGHFFAQIVDPRSIIVNAEANQVDAESLRFGQRAQVRFDAYPDLELPARVVSIGVFANSNGFRRAYVKTIPVRLKLERLDPRVIPNFTVSADVTVATEEGASIAPLESIFTDRAGAAPHVFVRTESGWEKRSVQLGLRSYVSVAVRDGLKPGQVIAVERPPR